MFRERVRPTVFNRIGDRYSHFFDFDHFMGRNALDDSWIANTGSQVKNGKKNYKIDLALPGFSKKDIEVSLKGDTLSVQIIKKTKAGQKDNGEHPVQFGKRYYTLPKYLDQENIKVKYRNGLLKIRIPYRLDAAITNKTVEVQ